MVGPLPKELKSNKTQQQEFLSIMELFSSLRKKVSELLLFVEEVQNVLNFSKILSEISVRLHQGLFSQGLALSTPVLIAHLTERCCKW